MCYVSKHISHNEQRRWIHPALALESRSGMEWLLRNGQGGATFTGDRGHSSEDKCSNNRQSRDTASTGRDQSPRQRQADLWELFTSQINTESTPEADKKTVMSQLQTIPHKILQGGSLTSGRALLEFLPLPSGL